MTQEEFKNHKQLYTPLFYANLTKLIEGFGLEPKRSDKRGVTYEYDQCEYNVMCIDDGLVGMVVSNRHNGIRTDVIVNQELEQALECKSMEELIDYVRRCNAD